MKWKTLSMWKYEIPFPDGAEHRIAFYQPSYTDKRIHLDVQNGIPCVWALVDTKGIKTNYEFIWVGTGHEVKEESLYIGTIQDPPMVWHLFMCLA